MLKELITIDDIEIGLVASNWEEAIRKSSQRLLEKGTINQHYVDSMINIVKETGPYFVIGNHVAFAHTRPEYGAKSLGLSFTTLQPPISFGSNNFDPIKLIVTFSATDSDAHLSLMSELANILMNEKTMAKLFVSTSSEEFYQHLINGLDN
ncbi:PTS sugar transporter subunit IIA [Gracilibacillus salitolerans]|uniref:Ascorbate-specific PTS system EIIA component n=1 Tax=Gracilibacillus salitolerans TaxID=2663022 RepID=A0A5Q2TN52_9BACI|nr:PTS sugar transporter subunit IIA [Gracilibacillus salitolerans]QGH36226.1 PTS sugar transporter subunit IIA [Gracilibacillus salitolerans]